VKAVGLSDGFFNEWRFGGDLGLVEMFGGAGVDPLVPSPTMALPCLEDGHRVYRASISRLDGEVELGLALPACGPELLGRTGPCIDAGLQFGDHRAGLGLDLGQRLLLASYKLY